MQKRYSGPQIVAKLRPADALDGFAAPCIGRNAQRLQRHQSGSQLLARTVMEIAGDAPSFALFDQQQLRGQRTQSALILQELLLSPLAIAHVTYERQEQRLVRKIKPTE